MLGTDKAIAAELGTEIGLHSQFYERPLCECVCVCIYMFVCMYVRVYRRVMGANIII